MPRKPPAPSEPADYRIWKSRAAALLERQGLPLGVMRERDWRQLYLGGATPEQAADQGAGSLLEHASGHRADTRQEAVTNGRCAAPGLGAAPDGLPRMNPDRRSLLACAVIIRSFAMF
jgi:hypothetical protein